MMIPLLAPRLVNSDDAVPTKTPTKPKNEHEELKSKPQVMEASHVIEESSFAEISKVGYKVGYNVLILSVAAIPMFSLFAAHECTSIGYFLSSSIRCGSTVQFSPISPVWSRLFLIIYYYILSKYCTMIES
jgi:hypothetical protein